MNDLIISKLNTARMALLACTTASEAKKLKDMAHAAEIYAKRRRLGEETEGYCREIKFEAEALLGEFLARAPKNTGAKGIGPIAVPNENRNQAPTLASLGITKKESSEAQLLATTKQENPKLFEEIKRGKKKVSHARREAKKKAHAAKVESAKLAPVVNDIAGPYDLVLADPPWRYEHCKANNREIENHYDTATLKEIFSHAPDTKQDAILYLWATAPKLQEAMDVVAAWGFTYRSCAVWDKEKIGMGYWWRIQHELLLVAVKGSPKCPPECVRVSSIFRSPRAKHSEKPGCVYEFIETAYPDLKKLEMYCRTPRPGWAVWGNEV